jgi:hypothetical protein
MKPIKITNPKYKEIIREQTKEPLIQNIAIGFAEALKELGHNNFEIIIKE